MANKRFDELTLNVGMTVLDSIVAVETSPDVPAARVLRRVTVADILALVGLQTFQTIADARACTTYLSYRVYAILGRVAPGDGLGGFYFFDPTSVVADNGAGVLKPTDIGAGDPGRFIQYL
jgi:hypothetical protein